MASSRPLGNIDANTVSIPRSRPTITKNAAASIPTIDLTKDAAAKPKATAAPKKRKSDAIEETEDLFPDNVPEIDDDDPRITYAAPETCNAVRRKIRNWIESGAMKVGEFQTAIGVSPGAYSNFMNRTGTWDGEGCAAYANAFLFFRKRELQGLPLKKASSKPKKAKTTAAAAKDAAASLFDVGGVGLPGEAEGDVAIYDTCDEVRKKIRAFLAKDGVTQAAFVREISKTFPDDRKVSAANLRYFMGQKGPISGNTNSTFYAAYVFFEKMRIKSGKPKSKFREEMEGVHGYSGVDTEHNGSTGYICLAGTRPVIDKYGRLHIV